jgi:hypothetical protein
MTNLEIEQWMHENSDLEEAIKARKKESERIRNLRWVSGCSIKHIALITTILTATKLLPWTSSIAVRPQKSKEKKDKGSSIFTHLKIIYSAKLSSRCQTIKLDSTSDVEVIGRKVS